jgi:phenylacetate-CoA ligase
MPLLRYRTGDYAEADTSACECGRHWPRIGRLLGKDADYLIRSDGTEVTVNILWALHVDMGSDIHEFQVCQEKPGHVEFRYVADMNLDVASERLLLSKLADIRGLNFSLRRVSTIKRGPRGKYQMVLQALPTTRSQLLAEVPKSNAESAR